jgi:hypothetical protein
MSGPASGPIARKQRKLMSDLGDAVAGMVDIPAEPRRPMASTAAMLEDGS